MRFFAFAGTFLLVAALRLWLVSAPAPNDRCRVRFDGDRVEATLTLESTQAVTLRWSRALEEHLLGFARETAAGWESFAPVLDSAGERLALALPARRAPARVRWTMRLGAQWDSPISGAARAGTAVVPAASLLPELDGLSRLALDFEVVEGATDEGGTQLLLPTGPWKEGESSHWVPADPRWKSGVIVHGELELAERVVFGDRALYLWTAADADAGEVTVPALLELLRALGPASAARRSDLVVSPPELAPFSGARTAWTGTHVVAAGPFVQQSALQLAATQIAAEVPGAENLWLVHGLRGLATRPREAQEAHRWRLALWERYSSLRAWKDPICQKPEDGRAFVEKAWAEVAAPLALDRLSELSELPYLDALRVLAAIAKAPATEHEALITSALGREAASFYREYVAQFRILSAPPTLSWNSTRSLPEATPAAFDAQSVPPLVLVCTANQYGYLETCGCALNQSGGAARRNTLLMALRQEHPEALLLDLGNFLPTPTDKQTQAPPGELETVWETLRMAPYDFVAASPTDLGFLSEVGSLASAPRASAEHATLLSANLRAYEGPTSWQSTARLQRGDRTLSVFGWSSLSPEQVDVENWMVREALGELREDEPFQLVREWLETLPEGDLSVVAGQLSPAVVNELVKRCPDLDVVLSARYYGMEPDSDEPGMVNLYGQSGVLGTTAVLYVATGYYGLTVFELGAARDATAGESWATLKERVIEFDASVAEHPQTRARIDRYYEEEFPAEAWDLPPLFEQHSSGVAFVGSQSCQPCHAEAYSHWARSKHGRAYETLLAARRQYVPKCVQCHVVGLGNPTGFARGDGPDSPLKGVGCEQCHGPGGEHVRSPLPGTIARSLPGNGCVTCHDAEHSPRFAEGFDRYLRTLRHWD